MAQPNQHLTYHYQKSSQYRVVHADGAYGGLTPTLGVFISFFNERLPIPQKVTHSVEAAGTLGPEISHESKEGIIREVEVGVIFDETVARSLLTWLQQRLENIKEIKEKSGTQTARVISSVE